MDRQHGQTAQTGSTDSRQAAQTGSTDRQQTGSTDRQQTGSTDSRDSTDRQHRQAALTGSTDRQHRQRQREKAATTAFIIASTASKSVHIMWSAPDFCV